MWVKYLNLVFPEELASNFGSVARSSIMHEYIRECAYAYAYFSFEL